MDLPRPRRRPWRYTLAAAPVACAIGAVALIAGRGDNHHPAARLPRGASATAGSARATAGGRTAPSATQALPPGSQAAAGTAGGASSSSAPRTAAARSAGKRGHVVEVADPEEASSYPVSASSVHRKAARTPNEAGSLLIAPGAPSNAEVREELAQMQAAEREATQLSQQRLRPVPGGESVGGNGAIPIPQNVPEVIQRVIAGANEIADFPYVFGGGHASFVDNAYDCSGSVSYALAAGGLLSTPEVSGELESWGVPGPGRYITVFANAGHTYMYVDGILFDTAGRSGPYASRWQVTGTDNEGYVERHWPGL